MHDFILYISWEFSNFCFIFHIFACKKQSSLCRIRNSMWNLNLFSHLLNDECSWCRILWCCLSYEQIRINTVENIMKYNNRGDKSRFSARFASWKTHERSSKFYVQFLLLTKTDSGRLATHSHDPCLGGGFLL